MTKINEILIKLDTIIGLLTYKKSKKVCFCPHENTNKIVEKWNQFATLNKLRIITKINNRRLKGIKNRLNTNNFDFDLILTKIKQSKFLLGFNQKNWKIDFDFIFLSDHNWVKILEGKYNDIQFTQPTKLDLKETTMNPIVKEWLSQ